jgi:GNAT superfamily N-acetyltransferase
VRRSTFAEISAQQGAEALNTVFQEYLLPMAFSAEQFELHVRCNDIDVTASPLWYDDEGKVLAAALLGVRGKRGWVGGFGVAAEYRGRGYARELLEELKDAARAKRLETVQLEVLPENGAAIRLYERGGFQTQRSLHSFKRSFAGTPPPSAAYRFVDPGDYVERPDATRPPWQREAASLLHGAASTALAGPDGAFALFRYNGSAAQIFKLGVTSTDAFDALTSAIASACGVRNVALVNEPDPSPVAGYAKTAGWTRPFSQFEMLIRK